MTKEHDPSVSSEQSISAAEHEGSSVTSVEKGIVVQNELNDGKPVKRSKWWVVVIILVVLASLAGLFQEKIRAWFGVGDVKKTAAENVDDGKGKGQGRGQNGGGRGRRADRGTPVVATATISTGRVVQGLTALGSVTASESVIVRPRVDGLLQKIYFTEGQWVRKGQVLAEIDPRQLQVALSQSQGQLLRDQAQLATAKQDLARYQQLQQLDAIAKQQVDTQLGLVRQLEASIKVDQAAINSAKLQLSYTKILAPISGRVGFKQVDAGNMIRGSDANGLATITQTQPVFVTFSIPQTDLPNVLKPYREKRVIEVIALDRDAKTELARGQLLSIDNQIDVATGTVKLRAKFVNRDDALFVNQFVNVSLVLAAREQVILTPQSSLIRGAEENYVYVLGEGSAVKKRSVKLGQTQGEMIEVKEGLSVGDVVVVDGLDGLRDGIKVNVAKREEGDNKTNNEADRRSSGPSDSTSKSPGQDATSQTKSLPTAPQSDKQVTPKEAVKGDPQGGRQALSEEERQKRRDAWKNLTEEEKQARRAAREARGNQADYPANSSSNASSQAGK